MILTSILTGIIAAILVIGVQIALIVYIKRRVTTVITSFVSQPDDKTPSQLATMVDQCAFILSTRLITQAKTTLMGMASVDSRNEKRAAADEILVGNPLLAMLLNAIPGGKRLVKNPEILSMVGGVLNRMGKGNGNKPAPPEIQPTFPL